MKLFYYTIEGTPIEIKGRVLGLIDNKQLAHFYTNPKDTVRKVSTGKTIDLNELATIQDNDCKDKRLLFLATQWDTCIKNSLIVSRKLVASFGCKYRGRAQAHEVSFLDENDMYLTISE